MKNSQRLEKNKNPGRGPIARKAIASARRFMGNKVIDLEGWKSAKISAENFQKTVISQHKLTEYDPIHGLYIYGQNQLSVIIEQIAELPILSKLADAYAQSEDEYMPSGPPMSPLTASYFTCWGGFDLSTGGAKKETLATVSIDLCQFMGADERLLQIFEIMQNSRMGIYKHEGASDGYVFLKELITDREMRAIPGSGYSGNQGEIWFTRVMPSPFDAPQFDYSVVFTTPYILGKLGPGNSFNPYVENDWLAYFERNLDNTNIDTKVASYEQLMKYGSSKNYWNEFIFLAYRNHQHDMILLEGAPDTPSTMPHTKEGRAASGL